MKHMHILGICGTFMGGIARLAQALGWRVSGSDFKAYPPMSDVLQKLGIEIYQGYDVKDIDAAVDCVVVGNVMTRDHDVIDSLISSGKQMISGPQWLHDQVLQGRRVIAIAGTHGKTTTTGLLTWLLHHSGMKPGYLMGGRCHHFEETAALGASPYFVIEADEYDTAFFDKRSKFQWYKPFIALINNLEFDHADIFADLAAIQKQFEYFLRLLPREGAVIYPANTTSITQVLGRGCWSRQIPILSPNNDWGATLDKEDSHSFELHHKKCSLPVTWALLGEHNMRNAVAAAAIAYELGLTHAQIIAGLLTFKGIKRRMELKGSIQGVTFYDDFAHHPTAVTASIKAVRNNKKTKRVVAVLHSASNSMRAGVYINATVKALKLADEAVIVQEQAADLSETQKATVEGSSVLVSTQAQLEGTLRAVMQPGDVVLCMSQQGFGDLYQRILKSQLLPSN